MTDIFCYLHSYIEPKKDGVPVCTRSKLGVFGGMNRTVPTILFPNPSTAIFPEVVNGTEKNT